MSLNAQEKFARLPTEQWKQVVKSRRAVGTRCCLIGSLGSCALAAIVAAGLTAGVAFGLRRLNVSGKIIIPVAILTAPIAHLLICVPCTGLTRKKIAPFIGKQAGKKKIDQLWQEEFTDRKAMPAKARKRELQAQQQGERFAPAANTLPEVDSDSDSDG